MVFLTLKLYYIIGHNFFNWFNNFTHNKSNHFINGKILRADKKSKYSEDVDHLVSINKNGVWIKEKSEDEIKMIYAKKLQGEFLYKLSIYYFNKKRSNLTRIEAEKANISENNWILQKVKIYKSKEKDEVSHDKLDFYSIFNLSKIKSAYKNLDTISFLNLLRNQERY